MTRRAAPGRTDADNAAIAAAEAADQAPAPPALEGTPPADGEGQDDAPAPAREEAESLIDKILPERVRTALGIRTPADASLLAEACYVFGINPDPTCKPRELAAFRFDPGEPYGVNPTPAAVVLVTAGGLKVRYPVDDDTEHRLRIVYNAFRVNKAGEREVLPLPQDLTLPRQNIDGQVHTGDHVYRTGYVKEGGAAEASRRVIIRQLRSEGRLR